MPTNKPKILLTTNRLILRTWQPSDTQAMAAINADSQAMKHFPSTQDLSATQILIDRSRQHYEKFGYGLYAVEIKNSGEFIGFVGLNHPQFDIPNFIPKSTPIVEIGWRLAPSHWNKGFATEAARAVLHHAFTTLNLKEIISFTVVANTPSQRVMEKIGLHHSAHDDFNHPKLDENSPLRRHVLFRLTQDEYYKLPK